MEKSQDKAIAIAIDLTVKSAKKTIFANAVMVFCTMSRNSVKYSRLTSNNYGIANFPCAVFLCFYYYSGCNCKYVINRLQP